MINELSTKRIILPIIAALIILVAIVSATTTLRQSAYAYTWPCIDRSEGKAPMTISGNNLYVAWWGNGTGNYEVMFKASHDNGQTFGDKINLSNTPNSESTRVEIDSDVNSVVVTWWETNQTANTPVMKISIDYGKTFGPMLNLSTNGTIGK